MPVTDCFGNSSWPLQPSSNQTEYQRLASAIIIRLILLKRKRKKKGGEKEKARDLRGLLFI